MNFRNRVLAVMIDTYIITAQAEEDKVDSLIQSKDNNNYSSDMQEKHRSVTSPCHVIRDLICNRNQSASEILFHQNLKPLNMLYATASTRIDGLGSKINGSAVGLVDEPGTWKYSSSNTEKWSLVGEALMPSFHSKNTRDNRIDGEVEMIKMFSLSSQDTFDGSKRDQDANRVYSPFTSWRIDENRNNIMEESGVYDSDSCAIATSV